MLNKNVCQTTKRQLTIVVRDKTVTKMELDLQAMTVMLKSSLYLQIHIESKMTLKWALQPIDKSKLMRLIRKKLA